MKKTFIAVTSIFLCISGVNALPIIGAVPQTHQQMDVSKILYFHPSLQKAIDLLHSLPEARKLIASVQKDGYVRVSPAPRSITKHFGACWESTSRSVLLNMDRLKDDGELVNTILFELHNASATPKLEHLAHLATSGQIDKDSYVKEVERIEYNNARHTSELLEEGVKLGILPESALWPVPNNFDDHYKLQQLHFHSQQIASQFEQISPRKNLPFHGTIPGLAQMSQQDRTDMLFFLGVKNDLESKDPQQKRMGQQMLHNEWSKIEGCKSGTYFGDCSRTRQKEQIIRFVLNNNPEFNRLAG